MSNLIGNLLTNSNALGVHSYALETTGKNLSNVNNPDYARQRVNLRENINYNANGRTHSLGLAALGIEHIRNEILDKQILSGKMEQAKLEDQADLLKQLEITFNESINSQSSIETLDGSNSLENDPGSLAKALDDLFNSFSELAALPESVQQRQVVLQRAGVLADEFNIADQRVAEMDGLIADQIDDDVAEVNRLLGEIAELNGKIARAEIKPGVTAPDLRDSRQAAMEELAQFINFEVRDNETNARMTDIVANDDSAPANDFFLVQGDLIGGEVVYDDATEAIQVETGGGNVTNLTLSAGGIAGSLNVKTQSLVHLRNDLDALANGIVTTVNDAYNASGTAGQDFFDPTGISADTIDLEASFINADGTLNTSNLRVSENSGGGNELALAMAELGTDDSTMAGQDFSEFVATIGTRIGQEVSSAINNVENQEIVAEYLNQQRQSHSGVSIDEEMTDLLRFQRAFQGTSRVINVLDQMLEITVSGLGR